VKQNVVPLHLALIVIVSSLLSLSFIESSLLVVVNGHVAEQLEGYMRQGMRTLKYGG
jgi:hypothetical protein